MQLKRSCRFKAMETALVLFLSLGPLVESVLAPPGPPPVSGALRRTATPCRSVRENASSEAACSQHERHRAKRQDDTTREKPIAAASGKSPLIDPYKVEMKRIFVGLNYRPDHVQTLLQAKESNDAAFFHWTILVSASSGGYFADAFDVSNAIQVTQDLERVENPIEPGRDEAGFKFQYKYSVVPSKSSTFTGRIEIGRAEVSTDQVREMLGPLPTSCSIASCVDWEKQAVWLLQAKGLAWKFDTIDFFEKALWYGFDRYEALCSPTITPEIFEVERGVVAEYSQGVMVYRKPRTKASEAERTHHQALYYTKRARVWKSTSSQMMRTRNVLKSLAFASKCRAAATQVSLLTERLAEILDDYCHLDTKLFEEAWEANREARLTSIWAEQQEYIAQMEVWRHQAAFFKHELGRNPRDISMAVKASILAGRATRLVFWRRNKTAVSTAAKLAQVDRERQSPDTPSSAPDHSIIWLRTRETRAKALLRERDALRVEYLAAQSALHRIEHLNAEIQSDSRAVQAMAREALKNLQAEAGTPSGEGQDIEATPAADTEASGVDASDVLLVIGELMLELLSCVPTPATPYIQIAKWGARSWHLRRAAVGASRTLGVAAKAARTAAKAVKTAEKVDKLTFSLRSTLKSFKLKPHETATPEEPKGWQSMGDMFEDLERARPSEEVPSSQPRVRSLEDMLRELENVEVPTELPAPPSGMQRASSMDELLEKLEAIEVPQHVPGSQSASGSSKAPQRVALAERHEPSAAPVQREDKSAPNGNGSSEGQEERDDRLDLVIYKTQRIITPEASEAVPSSVLDSIFLELALA